MNELSCTDLTFAYNQESPAIEGISATFLPGFFYGILGPNGCGKTTFLDLLIGSKLPARGSISLGDTPLWDIPKRELARTMTLVPQEFDTGFGYTVEEMVFMGRHPHIPRFASPDTVDIEAVDKALTDLSIEKLRHRFTTELSGGQKQRVVVARALAQQTPILLFDEATSNLDISHTIQIFTLARNLVDEGRTVIAVIHDLNLAAAYCNEILFLKEGTLRFQGKTEDILTAENISEIYAVKSEVYRGKTLRVHFQYRS